MVQCCLWGKAGMWDASFLSLMVIDWVMCRITEKGRYGKVGFEPEA